MVEIEKFSKIEIEINRIEIFSTDIEIGFYRIVFFRVFFNFGITSRISEVFDLTQFDINFHRLYFETYRISTFMSKSYRFLTVE
jgi:hypothetical protein